MHALIVYRNIKLPYSYSEHTLYILLVLSANFHATKQWANRAICKRWLRVTIYVGTRMYRRSTSTVHKLLLHSPKSVVWNSTGQTRVCSEKAPILFVVQRVNNRTFRGLVDEWLMDAFCSGIDRTILQVCSCRAVYTRDSFRFYT